MKLLNTPVRCWDSRVETFGLPSERVGFVLDMLGSVREMVAAARETGGFDQ